MRGVARQMGRIRTRRAAGGTASARGAPTGLRMWRNDVLKVSADPDLEVKLQDVLLFCIQARAARTKTATHH